MVESVQSVSIQDINRRLFEVVGLKLEDLGYPLGAWGQATKSMAYDSSDDLYLGLNNGKIVKMTIATGVFTDLGLGFAGVSQQISAMAYCPANNHIYFGNYQGHVGKINCADESKTDLGKAIATEDNILCMELSEDFDFDQCIYFGTGNNAHLGKIKTTTDVISDLGVIHSGETKAKTIVSNWMNTLWVGTYPNAHIVKYDTENDTKTDLGEAYSGSFKEIMSGAISTDENYILFGANTNKVILLITATNDMYVYNVADESEIKSIVWMDDRRKFYFHPAGRAIIHSFEPTSKILTKIVPFPFIDSHGNFEVHGWCAYKRKAGKVTMKAYFSGYATDKIFALSYFT